MSTEILVTLSDQEKVSVFAAAAQAGVEPDEYLKRSAYKMAILETEGSEAFQRILPGLHDIDAGRYAHPAKVNEVFAKYREDSHG